MKALFSIVSLVVVLAVVLVAVRHQLAATRQTAASAGPAAEASAPFGGASQPTAGQFEREVHRTLDAGMATRASQADAAERGQ